MTEQLSCNKSLLKTEAHYIASVITSEFLLLIHCTRSSFQWKPFLWAVAKVWLKYLPGSTQLSYKYSRHIITRIWTLILISMKCIKYFMHLKGSWTGSHHSVALDLGIVSVSLVYPLSARIKAAVGTVVGNNPLAILPFLQSSLAHISFLTISDF